MYNIYMSNGRVIIMIIFISSSGTISSSRLCGMTSGVPLVPLAVAGCVVCGMTVGVPLVPLAVAGCVG